MARSPRLLPGPLSAAFTHLRAGLLGTALFSCVINILALTGSFYTLQIYDRVIPSRSVSTLVALTFLAATLYAAYAVLDYLRARILSRAGLLVMATLEREALAAVSALALADATRPHALEPIGDLDRIRAFLSGSGPAAILDLPWIPVYLAAIYVLHPVLGMTALAGALGLLLLTALAEAATKTRLQRSAAAAAERTAFAESIRRNAETSHAMGFAPGLEARWRELTRAWLEDLTAATDTAQIFSATTKLLRLACQIGIVGLGALLVINGGMSAGAIVAASIIASRALSPIDAGLAHWRGFAEFGRSCRRLSDNLRLATTAERSNGNLPAPQASLAVEHLTIMPLGASRPLIHDLSFRLQSGDGLGVIGPSGCGKSTLACALVGARQHAVRAGSIRFDGAPLDHWNSSMRGRHVGYVPQEPSLLPASIADNISRFEAGAESAKIITAAKQAGIHEMILRLPDGYRSRISENEIQLSAGERRRIALARALYGDPFLVVLDEPEANLDGAGETSLTEAIRSVRRRGGIVVVFSHRLSALEGVDTLISLSNGRLQASGRKDDVLRRMFEPNPQSPRAAPPAPSPQPNPSVHATLKIVSDQHGSGSA
jgi:ATP-binding cassette subfamily C protein